MAVGSKQSRLATHPNLSPLQTAHCQLFSSFTQHYPSSLQTADCQLFSSFTQHYPSSLPTANSSLPSLNTILLPCQLPTANSFLNSTLSFFPANCRLPTANFFLNSALSTSKIILLPLMPNSQNSYGLLILDFKEGNISGITECNKQFT